MEMCYNGTLVMPSSYAVMDTEEMTYTDGGLYFNKSAVQGIVMSVCSYPSSVSVIANGIKASCVWVSVKLGAAFGAAGWAIGCALSTWVWSQAAVIAERLFSAVMRKKGVDFKVGWQWGIIPCVEGTIR